MIKHTMQRTLIAAAVMTALGTTALAQSDSSDAMQNPNRLSPAQNDTDLKERFSAADADQDGYISRDEGAHDQALTAGWSDYDADQDDMMSEEEYARFDAMQNPNRRSPVADDTDLKERFSAADLDQDGYISRDEGEADEALMTNWLDFDEDKDDMMSEEEYGRFDAMQNPNRRSPVADDTDLKPRG